MPTQPAWARNKESLPMTTLRLSPSCTSATFYSTGYVNFALDSDSNLGNTLADPFLVDPCVDICPLAPLDRPDGPRMGVNEYAAGCYDEPRWNHGSAVPRWGVRGWVCSCCRSLHDILLSPRRDGSSIRSLHLVLSARQLLCFSTRIRPCPRQDVHTQLEASVSCW